MYIYLLLLVLFNVSLQAAENIEIILNLPVERAEEFKNLRLNATRECPQLIGGDFTRESNQGLGFYRQSLQSPVYQFVFAQKETQLFGPEIIGMADFKQETANIESVRIGRIVSVYIKLQARKNGLGAQLMLALIGQIAKKFSNIDQLMLYISDSNESPIVFFKKLHFNICGTINNAFKLSDTYYNWHIMQCSVKSNSKER